MPEQLKIITETDRLILREFVLRDAEYLFHLNSDADVIRFTGNTTFGNVEEARQFILNYDQYNKYGFGRWAVLDKNNGDFLGWCGLKRTAGTNEHDIGYRFFKSNWGRGYATEAAKVSLLIGFSQFNMNEIIARAVKENLASIRVLEKAGMTYYKDFVFEKWPAVIYKIEKQNGKHYF